MLHFQNVLIGDDGTPLLTDFGSVRLADIAINTRNDVRDTLYCFIA